MVNKKDSGEIDRRAGRKNRLISIVAIPYSEAKRNRKRIEKTASTQTSIHFLLGGSIMRICHITLNTINDVKEFVSAVSKCEFDVDLVSGRYAIDAKSIMGIFSLDLSKPIQMNIHADNCEQFLETIKPYLAD